jgi:cyclophilin family peptidyl-prolyl cis-trans isomerase
MKRAIIIAFFALTISFACAQEKKKFDKAPKMTIDFGKTYTATIDTSMGKIVLTLFASEAPKTVNSFVFLAREKFYDGLIFHRVIPGFMIQGGDPSGTGRDGPGYQIENENQLSQHGFKTGTLGMANSGPHTNGSQFFICDADTPLPARDYTIFGEVKEGLEIVKEIAKTPRNGQDRPNTPVVMKSVTIEEK